MYSLSSWSCGDVDFYLSRLDYCSVHVEVSRAYYVVEAVTNVQNSMVTETKQSWFNSSFSQYNIHGFWNVQWNRYWDTYQWQCRKAKHAILNTECNIMDHILICFPISSDRAVWFSWTNMRNVTLAKNVARNNLEGLQVWSVVFPSSLGPTSKSEVLFMFIVFENNQEPRCCRGKLPVGTKVVTSILCC